MRIKIEKVTLEFPSISAWQIWLEDNHAKSSGVWLKFTRKSFSNGSLSYVEALEAALCYGWIDGQAKAGGDSFWLRRFTPRRKGSRWSFINREKAEVLVSQGRMKTAGLAEMKAAKQDGRWEKAYQPQRQIQVPADLQHELDQHPDADAFFRSLDSRNRYAILYRIEEAKKPETRKRRIAKFVAMLKEGKRLH